MMVTMVVKMRKPLSGKNFTRRLLKTNNFPPYHKQIIFIPLFFKQTIAHIAKSFYLCSMEQELRFIPDDVYGKRLLISTHADKRELSSNIRAARAILNSFPDIFIIINTHTIELGHKNPEYTINNRMGDRKGIMSEKGVTAGFKSAKKQGCKIVVIDLDEHICEVRPFELSKYISRRKADFSSGMMEACYIVYNGEAVVVNAKEQTRREIENVINELKP